MPLATTWLEIQSQKYTASEAEVARDGKRGGKSDLSGFTLGLGGVLS